MKGPRLPSRSGGRTERRLLAGLTLIAVIAVVVVIVLITRSPGPGNASAQGSTGTSTATVQRRNLVATDTESGTLSYANPQTVYNRVSGTITWLPGVGRLIQPGQALFRIDNQPIVLMNGATPAYRDLSASDIQGPDVLELNRNLIALGFNPDGIVANDVWQAATTAGVDQFQASLGESETGTLTLGQVVFLPGPQLISTVDGTVGSTGGGGGGSSSAQTSYDTPGSYTEFVGLTTTTGTSSSTTPTTTSPTSTPPHRGGHSHKHGKRHHGHAGSSLAALVALLKAEVAELKAEQHAGPGSAGPSSNAKNGSGNNNSDKKNPSKSSGGSPSSSSNNHPSSGSSGGGGGGSATEILQTSSTHLVVTVDLAASSQSEAVRGDHVTVQMPNNTTVRGVITQVSKVAQTSSSANSGAGGGSGSGSGSGSGGGSSATIPVTIRLSGKISGAGLDQAPVSVNFAQAKARNVLSVPVTALVATAGGNYSVQEAAAPHKLIPVQTGLFAAGYVAISGPGIYPGLEVTDSQG